MSQDKTIRIVLENEELQHAEILARTSEVDLQVLPKSQFLDPVTAVLVGGGVLAVGKFLVDLMDKLRGGIVIDLHPEAKEFVRRDRAVPYGWAVIRAKDGSVEINVKDAPKDASERLIGQIIDGVLKSAADVAKEAAKSIGKDKIKEALSPA